MLKCKQTYFENNGYIKIIVEAQQATDVPQKYPNIKPITRKTHLIVRVNKQFLQNDLF